MSQIRFELGNAMMHFNRTGGPSGFLWKFGMAYAVAALLIVAAMIPFFLPFMTAAFDPSNMNDPDAMNDVMMQSIGSILFGYLVALVLALLMWAALEAASQRRYMRGDGFAIRLGGDEARLLAVGFLWFVTFVALYILAIIVFMVPAALVGVAASSGDGTGAGIAFVLMLIFTLAIWAGFIWICARLSPAAAMTIRDRKIRFLSAWRVTKGRVWTLIGSWLLLWLIACGVFLVLYLVMVGVGMAMFLPALTGDVSEAEVLAMMTAPANLAVFAVMAFLFYGVSGAIMHAFGGPAALAARTDPGWAGGVTETFR